MDVILYSKIQKVKDNVADLEGKLINPESSSDEWEQGAISQTDGAESDSSYRIRNKEYLSGQEYSGFVIPSELEASINAWANGQYVGTLKNDGTFSTGTTNMVWVTSYSFKNYPQYSYRLTLRNKVNPNTQTLAPAKGKFCVLNKDGSTKCSVMPGETVTFYDGAENIPLKKLKVDIKPIQDFNGYECAWGPGGYRNLIPDGTDTTKGYIAGTYLKADGTTGTNANNVVSEYFPVEAGQTYTWGVGSGVSSTTYNASAMCFYNSSRQYISGQAMSRTVSHTLTAPSGAVYARSSQMIGDGMDKLIFEKGSTRHAWSPYSNVCPVNGQTGMEVVVSPTPDGFGAVKHSVSWESAAGTVFGGVYDPLTGELTVNYYEWVLGSNTVLNYITVSGNHVRFYVYTSHGIFYGGDRYSNALRQGTHATAEDYTWGTLAAVVEGFYIWLPYGVDGGIQSATENGIKSWLAEHDIRIVATIDNPTTYNLSALDVRSLKGENHISAETGTIAECEYIAKPQNIIGQAAKIPVGVRKYPYYGDKVNIQNHIGVEYLFTLTDQHPMIQDGVNRTRQGATVYGDYLFVAYNGMETLDVVDMRTGLCVCTITLNETYQTNYHCNNINFGWERYDSADEFPLLYISANHVDGICVVYRVQREGTTFTATLVQTIGIPPLVEGGGTNTRFCLIDPDNKYLYVEGHTTGSTSAAPDNYHRFCRYELPKLSDGDVNITLSDMIDYFDIPSVTAYQGSITMMGRTYQVYGWGSSSDFQQIDLWEKRLATYINLWDMGITDEPEACYIWRSHLCLHTVRGYVYKLYFD